MLIFDVLVFRTIPVIFIMAFHLKLRAIERDSTWPSPSFFSFRFFRNDFSSGFPQNLPDKLFQVPLTSHFVVSIPLPYTIYLL